MKAICYFYRRKKLLQLHCYGPFQSRICICLFPFPIYLLKAEKNVCTSLLFYLVIIQKRWVVDGWWSFAVFLLDSMSTWMLNNWQKWDGVHLNVPSPKYCLLPLAQLLINFLDVGEAKIKILSAVPSSQTENELMTFGTWTSSILLNTSLLTSRNFILVKSIFYRRPQWNIMFVSSLF